MQHRSRQIMARLAGVACIGIALVTLQACGKRQDSSSQDAASRGAAESFDPTVLRRGNGPEPETLDPQLARTDASFNILRDLFEGLTSVGPDGSAVPGAAE